MEQIMQIIKGIPVTAWAIGAIALVAVVYIVINAIRNKKLESSESAAIEVSEAPALPEAAGSSAFEGLSDEIIAVITAAVYAAMGSNVRIQSVRRVGRAPRSNWAKSGIAERVAPFSKR